MAELYEMDPVSRLTVGTLGEPGNRTFYLQGIQGLDSYAVTIEKEQAIALSAAIVELLKEIEARFELPPSRPDSIPTRDRQLQLPISSRFRVAQMGISYDGERDLVAVVVQAFQPEDDEGEPHLARFWVSRDQIAALGEHAGEVANAGRPICPLCGEPMEPDGHFCPRSNGHGQHL